MADETISICEGFNYLTEAFPEPLMLVFGDTPRRARALLARRSDKEMLYALESLDWILRQGEQLVEADKDETLERGEIFFTSRVKALQAYRGQADLSDQPDFPDATWAEYFAVLALGIMGEALISYNTLSVSLNKTKGPEVDGIDLPGALRKAHHDLLHEYAIEAQDAVGYAEQFRASEGLQQNKQETLRAAFQERGRRGGKIRASKYDELKRKVLARYDAQYSRRSNRNAARRIYLDLKSEIDAVLKSDDPEKTLEKWIGRHKRERESTSS